MEHNGTMWSSNVSHNFYLPSSYAIPLTVLNGLSCLIGSVANILVVIIITKSPSLHRVTDFLILSLACADLTVSAVMQPFFSYHINFYMETDGTFFGTFLDIIGYVSNLASIGSMFAVTFDRLIAIRFPFKYKVFLSKKKVFIIITITWICSITFGVFFRVYNMHPSMIWGICSLLLLGTLFSYPYIFYAAKKQERLTIQLTVQGHISPHDSRPNDNRRRVFAEKRAAKTVAIVVCLYGVCWLPILVYTQVKMNVLKDKNSFLPGFFVVYTMSMFNSALNPFVYCMRNRRYRKELRALCRSRRAVVSRSTTRGAHENKAQSST